MKKYRRSDIPAEVVFASLVLYSGMPVGLSLYQEATEVVKKYPEYFPWETTYAQIPKEVHDAYRSEASPDYDKPINFDKIDSDRTEITPVRDVIDVIPAMGVKEVFQALIDMDEIHRQEQEAEHKRLEKIWDKHYKKYNLPYRR